jgi:hypothetical protein
MIINKRVFLFFFFFFFVTYSFFGFNFTESVISAGKIDLESFKDIEEIPLTIEKLSFGWYGIYVWMYPHYEYSVRDIESPISLEFVIVMQQGGKTIEKKITKLIDKGFLGFTDWIFHVPRDFKWNGRTDILITNILLDDNVRDYYKAVTIAVVRRSIFHHWGA